MASLPTAEPQIQSAQPRIFYLKKQGFRLCLSRFKRNYGPQAPRPRCLSALTLGPFFPRMETDHVRSKKVMSVTNPVMPAADRELAEEAWAVTSRHSNHGQCAFGWDTLTKAKRSA